MRKACFLPLVFIMLTGCVPESQNKYLKYQNIVILSDLSSRINNLPPKDTVEIFKILDYFRSECVKPGEKIGDKSSIIFSALSNDIAATIDLNSIKSISEKQSFINSTGKFASSGLDQKLKEFKKSVIKVYDSVRNPGIDLLSILIEKIDKEPIVKKNTFLTDGLDTTYINFDNHIYIFTDGYLEYGNKEVNRQFYFGKDEIEKLRYFSVKNNVDILSALKLDTSLGIQPYKHPKNELINLHLMETHERDKNLKAQTYKHAIGVRDNEILEAVWRKWARESGFKSFEWKKY